MIRLTSRFSSRDIPEEFKGDAQVTAEVEVLNHMDDVKLVVLVFAAKGVQKFHLNQRLVVKSVQPARQHQQTAYVSNTNKLRNRIHLVRHTRDHNLLTEM